MNTPSRVRADNFARRLPAVSRPEVVSWSARMNGYRDSRMRVTGGWGVQYDTADDFRRAVALWRDDFADPGNGTYGTLARAYYAVSDGDTLRLMFVAAHGSTAEPHVMFLHPFGAWQGIPPEGPARTFLVKVVRSG